MSGYPGLVRLKPELHAGQLRLLRLLETHRFVLAPCGRRFGKTLFLLLYMLRYGINHPGVNAWWIDAIHYLAKRAFRMMAAVVMASRLADPKAILKSELRIELITGSVLEFHSAERGDRLRGEGVHLACLNEASLIKRELWFEAVYPMLTDTEGSAAFAFTPQGQGHFTYELFQRGRSADEPEYASLQLPTSANPHVRPEVIKQARRDLPADTFRQEYLAEFLADSSGVFRGIRDCVTPRPLDSVHQVPVDGPYVGGLDLAKHDDFTVLDILDRHGNLVWHDRFHRQDWPIMKRRIIEAARRYRSHLLVESNSIGDVIIDDLREAGVSCQGFVTSSQSKQQLIQELMVAIEQQLLRFPEIPELMTELSIFEYTRLPSGQIRYSAPPGAHDDEVMALALAAKAYRDMRRGQGLRPYLSPQELDGLVLEAA